MGIFGSAGGAEPPTCLKGAGSRRGQGSFYGEMDAGQAHSTQSQHPSPPDAAHGQLVGDTTQEATVYTVADKCGSLITHISWSHPLAWTCAPESSTCGGS